MRNYSILLTLLFSCILSQSDALSLDKLVKVALQNNNDAKIAEYQLDGAIAGRKGSFSSFLPSVNLSMNKSLTDDEYPLGYPSSDLSSSVSINQVLFDGARSWFTNQNVKNSIETAELNYRYVKEAIVLEVKTAYYSYLSTLEMEEVARLSLELADSQLELVEQQFILQAVSESDLLKAKVRKGQAELLLIQYQKNVESAMNRLLISIGKTAGSAIQIQKDDIAMRPIPDFDSAKLTLFEKNTRIRSYENQIDGAHIAYRTQLSVFFPTISISSNYSSSADDWDELFDGFGSEGPTTSLNLSLPIFNGLSNKSRLDQLQFDVLKTEESLRSLNDQLVVELDNILTSLEATHRILAINRNIVASAELDVKLAQERYRLGAIDILDVLNAQVSLIQTKSDDIRATFEGKISEAQLDVLLGTEFE